MHIVISAVMEDNSVMSIATQLELGVFNDAIKRDSAELTVGLRSILGAQLVAYIGGVGETRAVREWAQGVRRPSAPVVERLRLAYQVARLLERRESSAVVQAWFQGLNPQLEDESPAKVIREGTPNVVGKAVIAAARTFAGSA